MIAFSVKNSKTMYMFLVLSKESVAFVTQCPRILLNSHIYVNILNEIYKKNMQPQEISLRGALFCWISKTLFLLQNLGFDVIWHQVIYDSYIQYNKRKNFFIINTS